MVPMSRLDGKSVQIPWELNTILWNQETLPTTQYNLDEPIKGTGLLSKEQGERGSKALSTVFFFIRYIEFLLKDLP